MLRKYNTDTVLYSIEIISKKNYLLLRATTVNKIHGRVKDKRLTKISQMPEGDNKFLEDNNTA